MVDEMKLKSGIYFDSKTYEVTGFESTGDGINLGDEIRNVLLASKKKDENENIEKDNDSHGVASHVNQWRFRSWKNEVRNLEFYFNAGAATGNEMLRQLLHILLCLSLIDVTIMGITMDAGGINRRFVRCLMGGENTVLDNWLTKVSFRNMSIGSEEIFLSGFVLPIM